jgi:hypothetical protein
MEEWRLVLLGGAISTVTAGVVQWWQGRQATDRQTAEFKHLSERQQAEFAEQRRREQDQWDRERQERLDLEQRDVLRDLQAEAFALAFAAREMCDQNVEIAKAKVDGTEHTVSVERRNDAIRRFEASRARVYVLGASARSEEVRAVVKVIIPEAESLAFTPRERHRDPDPYYDIIDQRNRLNALVGRILRGAPGMELANGSLDPPSP